jgi:hypothetical protein
LTCKSGISTFTNTISVDTQTVLIMKLQQVVTRKWMLQTTVNLNGATIVVPAGAMNNDIKVTVDKVTDTSTLPINTSLKLISDVFEIRKIKMVEFSKSISITFPKSSAAKVTSMRPPIPPCSGFGVF